jgi:CheY-like chemotaxis protein
MSQHTIKMLVADDSITARRMFRFTAQRLGLPVEIVETADGRACLDLLERGGVDLAFVDVYMPSKSGLEAVWKARNQGVKTFVVLMSGRSNERCIEVARRLRAYDFLLKPFKPQDIAAIVQSYIRLSLPRRALVVDDSATVRRVINKVLAASMFLIDFAEAPDGAAALARCDAGDIDIVFLDCNMPGLGGLDTLSRIVERHPHIKVVMISGEWNEEREQDALRRGAFAFLHKPFYAGDIDTVLHDIYGISSPHLTSDGSGLVRQFGVTIVGRTISVLHKPTGSIYEYLWFRDAPHLRHSHLRENPASQGASGRHVRAEAERIAILELQTAKLVTGAAA